MTDKKDGGPKAPEKAPDRPGSDAGKRPFATIDLKATEVKTTPPKPGDKSPVAMSTPTSAAAAATGAASASSASASGTSVPKTETSAPMAGGSTPPPKADAKASTSPSSASTTTAAKAPVQAPPPASSGRFLGFTAAALAGAIIALAANAYVMPMLSGQQQPTVAPVSPEVVQRFASLEAALKDRATVAAVPSDLADRLKSLEAAAARIEDVRKSVGGLTEVQAKLQTETKGLAETVSKAPSAKDDVPGRLGKLEQTLAQIAAVANADPAKAAPIPQLTALVGRVADLESALATRLAELRKNVVSDIDTRIATATEASEAAKAGTARIDRDVAALRSKADGSAERIEKIAANAESAAQSFKALQEETGRIKVALDGIRADLDTRFKAVARPADVSSAVKPVADKIATLETSIAGVVKSEQDRRANAERIVMALELGNLKRAMERGTGYAAELAEVRKVTGKQIDLAALERFQDKGVPTLAELTRSFGPVANTILDAETARTDSSVLDRLVSGARTIVRVRKVSPAAGDDSVEAVVARMEIAVKEGRLTDVGEEAKKLPPKTAAPAQEWLSRVEARAAVDRALASLEGSLKAALGSAAAPSRPASSDTTGKGG